MGTLRLAQVRTSPSQQAECALREEGLRLFGAYLNLPNIGGKFASLVKEQTSQVGEFLGVQGLALGSPQFSFSGRLNEIVKAHFWPLLKHHGFTSFRTRTALRMASQAIQLVEIGPPGFADRELVGSSADVFQMRLGIYWPLLPLDRFGVHSAPLNGDRCQITTWLLAPDNVSPSLQTALKCLELNGLPWLSLFADPESALSIFQKSDGELFSLLPMTRHMGAESSSRRLLFLSFFAYLCHRSQQAEEYLNQAAIAIDNDPTPTRRNYQRWYEELRSMMF